MILNRMSQPKFTLVFANTFPYNYISMILNAYSSFWYMSTSLSKK